MTTRPDVSIVIPTRDRRQLLTAHALPGALGQVDVDVEVIVVDDGSTDDTLDALASVEDPRLRVLRNERVPGPSGARNTGIAAARGDWVAFLDDDDLWSPSKIRTQRDGLAGARWGFAAVIVVDELLHPLYALPLPESGAAADALTLGNIVPGGPSNVIAETTLVRELGGFDESLSHSADWDMWLRLAGAAAPAVWPDVLVASLEHAQRMIVRDRPDVVAESKRLFNKHGGASRSQRLAVAEWLASEYRSTGNYVRAAMVYGRAGVRLRSPGNVAAAFGALLGERGLRTVSRLLLWTRGATHLEQERRPVDVEPDWLSTYREALTRS
jgi:glycosyltransferase involved in cell wall biosynthesis